MSLSLSLIQPHKNGIELWSNCIFGSSGRFSMPLMSLLIRYAHIPFYFRFSFTFSTSLIHHYAPLLQRDRMWSRLCSHVNHTRLFDGHMPYDSHVFLVSPMCPPLQSDQSRALALRGQALVITLPYAHFLVFHSYLTCLYLPFEKIIITKAPTNCLYESPPELRFSTYALHHLELILHYFALHRTATIPPSLLATIHLEMIPYPQIAPPQSPIGFILRSLAP